MRLIARCWSALALSLTLPLTLAAVIFQTAPPAAAADCAGCAPEGAPITGPITHRGEQHPKPLLGCRFRDPQYPAHTGVDFPVDALTEVRATLPGTVVFAGERGPWGQLVIVENGAYQAWLSHNRYLFARVGDGVQRGDLLALSGNTGSSSGPHVHYAVQRVKGGWLDPERFFPAEAVEPFPCRSTAELREGAR